MDGDKNLEARGSAVFPCLGNSWADSIHWSLYILAQHEAQTSTILQIEADIPPMLLVVQLAISQTTYYFVRQLFILKRGL